MVDCEAYRGETVLGSDRRAQKQGVQPELPTPNADNAETAPPPSVTDHTSPVPYEAGDSRQVIGSLGLHKNETVRMAKSSYDAPVSSPTHPKQQC